MPDHHGHSAHRPGLIHTFQERAISWRTMERSLRLMVGVALAELIVSAVLLAVHGSNLPLPAMPVYVQGNQLFQMPVPVFLISTLFLVLAWSYLLTGALHAHPLVRLAGLSFFTFAMFGIREAIVSPLYTGVATGLLVAVWGVGVLTWVLDYRAARSGVQERAHRHGIKVITFAAVCILVALYYGTAWWSVRGLGAQLFPRAVTVQLVSLQFVLIPVLFLAGTDFAEWGDAIGERIGAIAGSRRPPIVVAIATAAVAVAILAGIIAALHREALHQFLLGLIVLGLGLLCMWRLRLHRGLPSHVPYQALAGAAVVYMAVMMLLPLASLIPSMSPSALRHAVGEHPNGTMATYRHAHPLPRFSMDYPAGWVVTPLLDQGLKKPMILQFTGLSAGMAASFYVVEASAASEKTLATMRQQWLGVAFKGRSPQVSAAPGDGPWQVTRFSVPMSHGSVSGLIWQRRDGPLFWLLMSESNPRLYHLYAATLRDMALSWQPTVAPATESAEAAGAGDNDSLMAHVGLFWLISMLVAGCVCVAFVRRLPSGKVMAAALLVTFVGAFAVLAALPQLRSVYRPAALLLPAGQHLGLAGVQAAVAVASLIAVGWLLARRRMQPRLAHPLALLLGLNVALQIIAWIFDGYAHAADLSGRFSVAQAVVVLLALMWDVTMSGEEITNVHGNFFPRHTRVLMFFGYVMLVAAMVLYFSSLSVQATGTGVEAQFETEMWPQSGLLALGLPLLLTLFVLRFSRWLGTPGAGAVEIAHGGDGPDTGGMSSYPMPGASHVVSGRTAATAIVSLSGDL